jgi:PAS domain-containing protein
MLTKFTRNVSDRSAEQERWLCSGLRTSTTTHERARGRPETVNQDPAPAYTRTYQRLRRPWSLGSSWGPHNGYWKASKRADMTLLGLGPEGFAWRKGRKTGREAEQCKQAEELLRDVEVAYRAVVERLPTVVYIDASDEVSSAIYMSPQCEEMLGYSSDEWISDPDLWIRLLHPEDRYRTLTERNRSRATRR